MATGSTSLHAPRCNLLTFHCRQESDYVSATGGFRISGSAPDLVKESMLYKLSYYDFAFKHTATGMSLGSSHDCDGVWWAVVVS